MAEASLLENMLNSNPNLPAQKGELLILHTEMKSEFRSTRSELGDFRHSAERRFEKLDGSMSKLENRMGKLENRMGKLENSVELIAQNVATLIERADRSDQRLDRLERGMSTLLERTKHLS